MVHWTWLIAAIVLGWFAGVVMSITKTYRFTTREERDVIVNRIATGQRCQAKGSTR